MAVTTRRSAGGARELTADAFNLLLGALDADRERAGEQYERVRDRLVSLFRWRGCAAPEELADRTFDRVARRLAEGATLWVADPYVYFHGVALNVLREHWRDPGRDARQLDPQIDIDATADPETDRQRVAESRTADRRVDCLGRCLRELSPDNRRLIETYHASMGGAQIAERKRAAYELGIPLNALRIRAFRIRVSLQSCVSRCVGRTPVETI